MQSMARSTECVLSFGSNIQVQWTQTQDGSISIILRHTEGGIANADPLRLHSHSTDTMVFRAVPDEQLESRDRDSQDASEIEHNDGLAQVARNISQKIENGWKKSRQSIESSIYQWSREPSTFFGTSIFTSREAWSFASLCDSDKNLHQFRSPFHKANLSDCLKSRIREARRLCPGVLEQNCRSSLLNAINPGLDKLTCREKKPLYRKFERYIEHGHIILTVASINAGLLLTVAPFLSTNDFVFLSKHLNVPFDFNLPWLSSTIVRESVKLGPLALRLLAYARDPQPHRATTETSSSLPAAPSKRIARHQDALPRKRPRQAVNTTSQRPPLPTPAPSQETSPTQQSSQQKLPSYSIFSFSDESGVVLSDDRLGDSAYLYLLFHFFGGAVPESLFERTRSPQSRWSENGVKREVMALDAGVDRRLFSIVSDECRLRRALGPFYRHELSEPWVYSLEIQLGSNVSRILSTEEKEKWSIRNLELICFGFSPRALRGRSGSERTVQSLIPLVSHVLQALQPSSVSENVRAKVSEALLAVSHLSNQIRRRVLPIVAALVNDGSSLHLQAEMAYAQSIASRLLAEFEQSERFIHDFCCRCGNYNETCIPNFYRQYRPDQVDQRMNALYGRLHRSHLENLVQCEKYESAIEEVDYWQVPTNPSPLESLVRPSLMVTVCKIFRSQGLFLDVRERLELCLLYPGDSNKTQVLCNLADVYCDLAEVGGDSILPKAQNSLDMVRHLIDPELKKRSTNSKAFRRLKVSQIEMDIQAHRYEDARKNILEMKRIFSNLFNLDVSDQLLHVRVLIASARVYHIASDFVEAIQEWRIALKYVQKYASFEGEGFTYAAINLSLSLAYLKTGHGSEASISFNHATELLLLGIQDYWIPTLWAWVEDTLFKIQSMSGWKSDWIQRSVGIRRTIEKDYRIASPWLTENPNFAR